MKEVKLQPGEQIHIVVGTSTPKKEEVTPHGCYYDGKDWGTREFLLFTLVGFLAVVFCVLLFGLPGMHQ